MHSFPMNPDWPVRSEQPDALNPLYLRYDDVHLSTQFPQCVHQLLRIFVNSNPASIHKDFCGTEQ